MTTQLEIVVFIGSGNLSTVRKERVGRYLLMVEVMVLTNGFDFTDFVLNLTNDFIHVTTKPILRNNHIQRVSVQRIIQHFKDAGDGSSEVVGTIVSNDDQGCSLVANQLEFAVIKRGAICLFTCVFVRIHLWFLFICGCIWFFRR